MSPVPAARVRACNDRVVDPRGAFVLAWMIAARRARHSFALDRAVEHAAALGLPLVVVEALRVDHRFASDRLHRFAIDGMADNARAFAAGPALYHPYVERAPGEGRGLLEALAQRAAVVVTDDFPTYFLPRMVRAFAARAPVRVEQVDGNGLYPMRAAERVFTTAASFRRHLQKVIRPHLDERPREDPFAGVALPRLDALPAEIAARWPRADPALLAGDPAALAALPIDHRVSVVATRGGATAAGEALRRFVAHKLSRYLEDRDDPDADGQSHLSPYLHWGHLSAHEVFAAVTRSAGWHPGKLCPTAHGSREGWWNASGPVDAFLDQLVTWREIGFNICALRDDHASYASLPSWALTTLDEHRADPRRLYTFAELEEARTGDPVWNAAQRELYREGRIHNYLRMLWGKKILGWTRTPEEALATMIALNDRWALDGRDPNSYSGILWVLGRYDRAWGPEREIFGKVRYMSSDSAEKKLRMRAYLARYAR